MRNLFVVLSFVVLSAPVFSSNNAIKPQLVSQHKDWAVYKAGQGKETVYYTITHPKKSEGKYSSRGDVYILITNRPKERQYNVVSFHAGYPFKDGATIKVKVDDKIFTAFASGDTCWFPDDLDARVTDAFSKGKTLKVEGTSARGTNTVDTFSLAGSSAALKDLNRISKKG